MSAIAPASPVASAAATRARLGWLLLSALVIVLDQASKWYVEQHLTLAVPVAVLPVLDLTLLHNTGAAFSFLASEGGWQRWFFTVLALGVSALITWWLVRLPPEERGLTAASLALVLGGALGNVIDRMRLGYVIDFVHVHYEGWYFPAFNVADSAITVGAIILGVSTLFPVRPAPAA